MKFGADFHDTYGPWIYLVKAAQIGQDFPSWRVGLTDWFTKGLIANGMPKHRAYEEAEQFMDKKTYPAIPPQYAEREPLSRIIGDSNYDSLTRHMHGSPSLEAPMRPGAKKSLQELVSTIGHEAHLVTVIRGEHRSYVPKFLEIQGIYGLFAGIHYLHREESKVLFSEQHGVEALVDNDANQLRDYKERDPNKKFAKVLVGAGISAEEALRLEQDAEFIKLIKSGSIDARDFLNMLVKSATNQLNGLTVMNGSLLPFEDALNQQRIIYAPTFDQVNNIVNTFAERSCSN